MICMSKELFPTLLQNDFIEALLHGKSKCTSFIPTAIADPTPISRTGRPLVPLSKKLYLELDNSAKDDYNWFVMVFCLLQTARYIFNEFMAHFLIVGHTYKDIDTHFSYLSKLIKKKNTGILSIS